jgi:hypothetical protein
MWHAQQLYRMMKLPIIGGLTQAEGMALGAFVTSGDQRQSNIPDLNTAIHGILMDDGKISQTSAAPAIEIFEFRAISSLLDIMCDITFLQIIGICAWNAFCSCSIAMISIFFNKRVLMVDMLHSAYKDVVQALTRPRPRSVSTPFSHGSTRF